MKVTKKTIFFWFSLLTVLVVCGSYSRNYAICEMELHEKIDNLFKEDALLWGESVMQAKGIPYWGKYDLKKYVSKKETTILSAKDTIVISSSFYHPDSYVEYQHKNMDTFLLLGNNYDIMTIDSLFKMTLAKLGIITVSSVELKIRDLAQMFPASDSICIGAPFVETVSSGSIKGYTTDSVGVGICNHALLYGHVKIPFSVILSDMEWFGIPQITVIICLFALFSIVYFVISWLPHYSNYKKNTVLIGNTCIDMSRKELYLWNGECRHITDIKFKLVKMIVEAAPAYLLSKEEVCRTIWNRNSTDGQALYNVAMKDIRTLFITEDPSLELKSLPREGMQLLVNTSLIEKGRWFRFLWVYLSVNFKRKETGN